MGKKKAIDITPSFDLEKITPAELSKLTPEDLELWHKEVPGAMAKGEISEKSKYPPLSIKMGFQFDPYYLQLSILVKNGNILHDDGITPYTKEEFDEYYFSHRDEVIAMFAEAIAPFIKDPPGVDSPQEK